ncbi:hypothetical protein DITRI_Ditri14bG0128900 [Diplodiscus trichospermus]
MAFPFHAFALRSFPSFSFSKLPCHSFGKHSLIFQRWNDLNLSSLTYKASILEEFLKIKGGAELLCRNNVVVSHNNCFGLADVGAFGGEAPV